MVFKKKGEMPFGQMTDPSPMENRYKSFHRISNEADLNRVCEIKLLKVDEENVPSSSNRPMEIRFLLQMLYQFILKELKRGITFINQYN